MTGTTPARPPSHKRVCIVTDSPLFYPPFTAGGDVKQLSELASQLGERNVECTVVARQGRSGAALPPVPSGSLRIHYVPPGGDFKGEGWAALWPVLRFVISVFFLLLRKRATYDILLVSGFRTLALPSASIARLTGKRCIVRIETPMDLADTVSPESASRIGHLTRFFLARIIRGVRRASFALADGLVVFTDQFKTHLERLGAPPRKIKCVPNGIDTGKFTPLSANGKRTSRTRLGLPMDKVIFVYTGRICRSKGVLDLLRSWKRLAHRQDLFLLLVGSGADSHDSCETEAREFMHTHECAGTLTGMVGNVSEYLQASDVFIFLSHAEAFSLSILEALATGLPSIVTNVGGAPEVVRHHEWGALVDAEAPVETILNEVEWLMSRHDMWPSMGHAARSIIVAKYAMPVIALQYIDLFDGV
jgi:glycosyltransferase involved in cell wall biosynthesis